MPRRLLNIASVVCLVACVALMGMWVRSYRKLSGERDSYWAADRDMIGCVVFSTKGLLILYEGPLNFPGSPNASHWPWIAFRGPDDSYLEFRLANESQLVANGLGFGYVVRSPEAGLILPYWFLVLISGLVGIALRLESPRQFKLRSLFTVTTFLAVVLGMIAWLDRAWIGM